jgi:hypothetical protein
MERLYSRHFTNTLQYFKPGADKTNGGIMALNSRFAMSGIIPSLVILSLIGFSMFHLGWKMSVIVLLFAPLPTFIRLLGTPKKTKRRKLFLTRRVKIYASVNEKPGIWLLLICISLNNKVFIRQWKLQTYRFSNPEVDSSTPLKLLR